ncbi:four helix bundle protein [Blastopirellula sp. J2-11]|uniref:four helix bundle protein n=1 Tax=Blastopirellula sp. J2-11 TaxID=2943192 RepID=UPI003967A6A9
MNDESRMPNDESSSSKRAFDLEERTARFGEAVVRFLRALPENSVTRPLIQQAVRSATSIGANYCEADDAGTKKEFKYRISVCKRETRETKHWHRMLATAIPEQKDECRELWQDAKELHLIFAAIFRKS